MTIGWAFQTNTDGTWDGWNDSAIAGFKGKRLESLTREIIQNSLDAALSGDEPVYLKMDEVRLGIDQLPDFPTLKDTLSLCWESREHEATNSKEELRIARETASKDSISVLSISDEGTTGMPGPCVHGKPFFSYLKARGQSGGSDDRGGSHGIGKAAPLCTSDLRTIFVSTRWEDRETGDERTMIQGRATLMSHKIDGRIMRGVGFWGKSETFDAICEDDCEFGWLKRDEIGTTVFVIGWNRGSTKDWELYIIIWAAVNFFAAFARGKLVLSVGNNEVNRDNIADVLNNSKFVDLMKAHGHEHRVTDSAFYLRCITDEGVTVEESQLPKLGHSRLRLIVEDDAPRKIAIIRKNMLITDQLGTFWRRPPARYKDFVGIFECLNPDGEMLLRAMEPPAHNDLSKDNLPLTEMVRGTIALRSLGERLKELVDKHAGSEAEDAGEIDFLKEFFADEAEDGAPDIELEDRDPNGIFLVTPKPVKLPPPKPIKLDDVPEDEEDDFDSDYTGESGGAGEDGSSGGDGGGRGSGSGSGEDGTGDRGQDPKPSPKHVMELRDSRIVRLSKDELRLHTTPTESRSILIELLEVGADADEELSILSCDNGDVIDGMLSIVTEKDTRLKITMKASRSLVGGVKAIARLNE